MRSIDEQHVLFEDATPPATKPRLPKVRVAPCYVWPSAVEEWERIHREMVARGVDRRRLIQVTDAEFCRRDLCRPHGGTFPRRGVHHG